MLLPLGDHCGKRTGRVAGPAGPGRELTRRPRRVGNDRRIRPTPAAAPGGARG
jgi:hypothetical protein